MSATNSMDDGIDLYDLFEQLRQGWRWLAGGVVLGLALAGAAIGLIPTKYEAGALVRVGQVGLAGRTEQAGPAGQVAPVEAPAEAVERMKTTAFVQAYEAASGARKESLVVAQARNSALVQVKATATTQPEAVRLAVLAVQMLVQRHAALAQPRIGKLRADLAEFQNKLIQAERELHELDQTITGAQVPPSALPLLASLRIQKAAETIALRDAVNAHEMALLPPATQPTAALEEVVAANKPVEPRKVLLLALGPMAGLFAALLLLFARSGWRRAAQERAAAHASDA